MLRLVLIKTGNAPIPTMKIHQIEYYTGFLNSTPWKIRCSLNPKAQAVNKVQRQLRPEPYFPEFFKSRAQKHHLKWLQNTYWFQIRFDPSIDNTAACTSFLNYMRLQLWTRYALQKILIWSVWVLSLWKKQNIFLRCFFLAERTFFCGFKSVCSAFKRSFCANRLLSTIGGNRKMDQLYTTSQVSNITMKTKFSHNS